MRKKSLRIVSVFLVFLLFKAGFAAGENPSVLVKMFDWWNGVMSEDEGFTEDGFRRYFTEKAAIIINQQEVVRGIKPLVTHFKKIQQNTDSVEILLPFESEFSSADGTRIFTHHRIRASMNGEDRITQVMGYAKIEEGKIALIDFIRYDEKSAR